MYQGTRIHHTDIQTDEKGFQTTHQIFPLSHSHPIYYSRQRGDVKDLDTILYTYSVPAFEQS